MSEISNANQKCVRDIDEMMILHRKSTFSIPVSPPTYNFPDVAFALEVVRIFDHDDYYGCHSTRL